MHAKGRQLAGLVEDVMYYFGVQGMEDECCGEKISPGEFRALRTALRLDVCTMQDIARRASITKGGATRIITRLEEKGLAHRVKDQKDGRVCCVTLTEEGESLLSQIEDQLTNKMMAILEAMDPAMRDILIISLNSFLQTARRQSSGK
ncbi:MAG: HTH-type transcriptional regulator Hpr [Syntrophaceae bacterium PtaB.Bin095]|nr:MAG: HTH-type transcriptional regulator Hpr [Syntrophaceae bacterium PtaB.Bin095]